MIKYNDILYEIGIKLKDNFSDYQLRVKKNQKEIEEPTFYVEVRALSNSSYKYYDNKLVNITITYTDKVVDNEKLNSILNELESVFTLGIKINGTFLLFKNKNYSINDDFLTMNLTVNYKDSNNYADENSYYSAMLEELYLDLKLK